MCGLVGMIGNIIEQDKKAFRNLLRFDVVRGEDSTGVAVVGRGNDDIHLYKKVGAPDVLFQSHEHFAKKGIYSGPDGKLFIGHNRYATTGKIIDENAHPFHHNTVVGAHNGTLDSLWGLEKGTTFDVDSEAIFYNLDKYDAEETIGNVDGAYALTWADMQENRFFVIRNKERPLHWTRRTDMDVIYWASMPWMLELALAYAGINHGDVHEFATDTLYSLDMSLVDESKARSMKWNIKQGVKGYQWASNYNYGGQGKTNFTTTTTTQANQNGGGTGNSSNKQSATIHPFKPSSSSSSTTTSKGSELTKDEQAQWSAWVDRDIDFRVQGSLKGMGNTEFVHCYPDDPLLPAMNIRIFAHGNTKLWNTLMNSTHRVIYTGKVKRFVRNVVRGKKEYYLAIDLRTITVKEMKRESETKEGDTRTNLGSKTESHGDKDDSRFYEGYQNAYLTLKEFNQATKDGCACCSKDAGTDDDEIVWLDHETFLCGDCSALEVNQSYVNK